MPWSIDEGKQQIKEVLNDLIRSPETRVLDLGCGRGTYARLIEKPCYKIGVDAVDYYREYALMMVYDKFLLHDIRDTDWLKTCVKAEICVCGDVLEHLSIKDARAVLDTLESFSEAVIVALPFEWKQNDWNGYEGHIQDDLTPAVVAERYPELEPLFIFNSEEAPWKGRAYYGYYIWRKNNV